MIPADGTVGDKTVFSWNAKVRVPVLPEWHQKGHLAQNGEPKTSTRSFFDLERNTAGVFTDFCCASLFASRTKCLNSRVQRHASCDCVKMITAMIYKRNY